ncbi:putative ribonuclease H-like domain-containing protein [Tanacetum coccineum]
MLPLWTIDPLFSQDPKSSHDDGSKPSSDNGNKVDEDLSKDSECNDQEKEDNVNITNNVNAASINEVNVVGEKTSIELLIDPNMPALEDVIIFDSSKDDEDDGADADMNNLDTIISYTNKKDVKEFGGTWEEPKKVIHALKDPSWIEAMQEELLQFKNKKDEMGIVIRNKARLVAQEYTQEERIDYDEVFAHVAGIEAIRLFLAYASFKDFVVYQMDVKSAFLYGKIEKEVYVCQPLGFEDLDFPGRVYKVEKALYGLHQAPRAWYETLLTYLLDNGFQRGKIDKTLFIKSSMGELTFFLGLQVQQKKDGIFICQDKYVVEILKKFRFIEVKTASTPMETQKPLLKDEDGEEVDVHMYRSMIGSLMYLTSSRPDIMFAVCAYARYQVNPKVSHLQAMKNIFRYLKGQPKLGIWYPKDSPFDLVAYIDNNYAGASLVRKSTIGGKAKKSVRLMMEKLFSMESELILVNTVNGKVQLHALVDGKKIIITESTVRRDLQLEVAKGIDCLPNSTIFEQLAFIGMVKNLDNVSGNFLMYPRFVQVFMNQQLDGLPSYKRIHDLPSHTKKIFGNMRRVGKCFSGRVTPLFPTMVVKNQTELGKGSAMPTDPHHTPTIVQSSTQPQKTQKSRKPKRKDTQVPQPSGPTKIVADEAVHKELGDSLVRADTTASNLEVEQDSGGGPRRQETIRDTIAQIRFKNVSKQSNDPPLARVLDLENTKTTQANEIASLKRRVKKLKKKDRSRSHKLKRLYIVGLSARVESSKDEASLGEDASKQGRRINAIDADEDITLVNVQNDADNEMFDVNTLTGDEVSVEQEVVAKDVNITVDEVTLAQALVALKSAKPKVKGIVFQEPGESTTTTTIISLQQQSQGKAKFDEEERLARDKDEVNVALTKEWDDIQAKIEVDHELAQRLQAEEQEELSDADKATLFQQLLKKRRKYFTAK